MLSEPHYNSDQKSYQEWMDGYDTFIRNIINQPIKNAKRCTDFGYARYYQRNKLIMSKISSLPVLKKIIRKLSYR